MPDRVPPSGRAWITDILIGGFVGGVIGAIVAVNLVINLGPDSGYESSFTDVFDHNMALGIATIFTLVLGPVAGILLARRQRRPRQ